MLIYYYIQNSNCSDKEKIYYVLFTNKTNGKMPSEIGHQFQNMVLYILYFKFWLCVLIEKCQLEAKSSLFRHCDSGYVLTRMRPSS